MVDDSDEAVQTGRGRRWDARIEAMVVVSLAALLLVIAEQLHPGIPTPGELLAPAVVCCVTWLDMGAGWLRTRAEGLQGMQRSPWEPSSGLRRVYLAIAATDFVLAFCMVWMPVAAASWFSGLVVLSMLPVPLAIVVRTRLHGW